MYKQYQDMLTAAVSWGLWSGEEARADELIRLMKCALAGRVELLELTCSHLRRLARFQLLPVAAVVTTSTHEKR
jgi:hypothetical protein